MELKTEYRRDLQHTWMILSGGSVPEEEAYSVRMLAENRIKGLLPCKTVSLDGELRFYYDISSRQSFSTVVETEPVNRQILERLLISLAKVMEQLSEYLLDPDGLLLDLMYLYCIPDRPEICFCWYPDTDLRFSEQAKILASALLPLLEQADRAGVVIGYRFYQYCMAEELTIDVLHGLLRQKGTEQASKPAAREEIERAAVLDAFFDDSEEEEQGLRSFGKRVKEWLSGKKKKRENREESYMPEPERQEETGAAGRAAGGPDLVKESPDDYLAAAGSGTGGYSQEDTILLNPEMLLTQEKRTVVLRIREPQGKEREIPLTKEMYLVGKTGSGATLQLSSAAVSRLHAKLEREGEGWAVFDLNSRNGTRILRDSGGQHDMLQPGEAAVLRKGDVIWFADVMCQMK